MSVTNKNPFPLPTQPLEKNIYPLSYAQQAMWFLYQLAPEEATHNMGFSARVCSTVDVDAFKAAFQDLINRHACLRTTFFENSGIPLQEVHEHRELQFEQIDASSWDENRLAEKVAETYRKPFDLRHGPALRVHLFTKSQTEHVFLLTVHHIVFDSSSLWIFLNEFRSLYAAKQSAITPSLSSLQAEYANYIQWESELVSSPVGDRDWAYWQKQLASELPVLNLPTDRPHPPIPTSREASHHFLIEKGLAETLKSVTQMEGTTLYTTLLAAFQALLYRYSGQEDFLIGSSVNSRSSSGYADIVGYMVNVVALRADLSNDPTFGSLLKRTHQTVLGMLEHQDYPFPLLVERLKPQRETNRPALYQVFFDLQTAEQSEELTPLFVSGTEKARVDFGGLTLEAFDIPQQEGLADLSLQVWETDENLRVTLTYNTDLFDASTITRMGKHFLTLLAGSVSNPEQQVSKLPLLTEAEQHQLLIEWNDTQADYLDDQCIHQLFEAQVEQTPDAIAVVFEDKHLTYRELNQRANQLAHYLLALGIKPEALIGISIDRSLEMIVGVLGVLKAGGAYVPLDPGYPKERLAFMMADAQVPVILTRQHLLHDLPSHTASTICLDTDWPRISQESEMNPVSGVTADNLAYIIYTSGSTGNPKGVMIEHRSLVNYITAVSAQFGMKPGDRILQFASINFDTSAEEIYTALIRGATLVLRNNTTLDSAARFLQKCREWQLTVLGLPTAYWHELTMSIAQESLRVPESLRLVIIGGEKAMPEHIKKWQRCVDTQVRLLNAYGPTENTISATMHDVSDPANANSATESSIGRPIRNVQAYILDKNLQPVPIGVPGELHLSGAGLARGYLNNPKFTSEKFIANPFSDLPHSRLYKTGDLVRYAPDGNIEFLGRVDHQVKIRGFRIELEEIETALSRHPAVRENLVLARADEAGRKDLVAYLTLDPASRASISELRQFLKQHLPEYMIPASFVVLDEFPMTPNGKLDRRALPAPESTRPELEHQYVAPRDEIEESLARIFADVLKLERVGIRDNFFELGGHSLLAIQAISRLRETFQMEIPVNSLFANPTVMDLAEHIRTIRMVLYDMQPVYNNTTGDYEEEEL